MRIGIPREIFPGEARVAATPDVVREFAELGFDISVQSGAGAAMASTLRLIAPTWLSLR